MKSAVSGDQWWGGDFKGDCACFYPIMRLRVVIMGLVGMQQLSEHPPEDVCCRVWGK